MSLLRREDEEEGLTQPLLKKDGQQTVYAVNSDDDEVSSVELSKQTWNDPPENISKALCAFFGFIIMGMFDAALGALLPSLEDHYGLTDIQMSCALLAPTGGYLVSAVVNTWVHYTIGRGGLSCLGVGLQLLNFLIVGLDPPYWLLLSSYVLQGFGAGLVNGAWNAWFGAFRDAHGILGVLQGFYAVGAFVGPATVTMLLENELVWYHYYYILSVACAVNFVLALFAFRHDGPSVYRKEIESEHAAETESASTWEALKNKNVILLSILLYAYQGTEMSLSDWIVTYMIRARNGDPKRMGLMSSCLWFGLTAGRIGLGFVTGRFKNQQRVVLVYLVSALAFQIMFWGVHHMVVSALAIFAVGFFTGPMYPSAMILATDILPKRLHVPGICAAVALSGVGSATLPVTIGTMVGKFGAWILQPLLFSFLIFLISLWTALPNNPRP